ncbi:MAG: hypothetical protein N2109_03255 [Fimbriimonadales bacterium]|nr:hypothetical protein [Fimbriimonadales bacterium]
MGRTALLPLAAWAFGSAWSQVPFLGRSSGYVAGPPRVACGAEVQRAVWSTDGKRIWIHRSALSVDRTAFEEAASKPGQSSPEEAGVFAEEQVVVYDLAKDQSTVVWRSPARQSHVVDLAPLGAQRALLVVRPISEAPTNRVSVLRLSSRLERPVEIARLEANEVRVAAHSDSTVTESRAALLVSGEATALFLASASSLRPLKGLENPRSVLFRGGAFWVQTGGESTRWLRLDPATGALREGRPPLQTDSEIPLRWEQAPPVRSFAATRSPRLLWIGVLGDEGGSGRALLSADAGALASVSPTAQAVLYTVDGVAFVRELYRVPTAALRQALAETADAQRMANAKQAGLALLMFASDHDDVLPTSLEQLGPYLKDPAVLEGFVFTGAGLSVKSVENPAQTEIGYLPGSDGERIVVFLDGHVERRR